MTEETETTKEQYKDKFKVGDKVVLVRKFPGGSEDGFRRGDLVVGKEYTVSKVSPCLKGCTWCK